MNRWFLVGIIASSCIASALGPIAGQAGGQQSQAGSPQVPTSPVDPIASGLQHIDNHHLHNLWQLSTRVYSGSEPDSPQAFEELAKLGVTTIVSVDGIAPSVELAKKHGMRYVHIPIGYDGIDPKSSASLTRVAREVTGKIYVHCHHGKHRGPAAAAILCRADDGRSAPEAEKILQVAGTGKEYTGLWRDVAQFRVPDPKAPLPELVAQAPVESLAAMMAKIDRTFDRLKLFQQHEWKPLADQPDLSTDHEVLQLKELFTEVLRASQAETYKTSMQQTLETIDQLQSQLSRKAFKELDGTMRQISSQCVACHERHRNQAH